MEGTWAGGAISNEDGFYEIVKCASGYYNVRASFVGFKTSTAYEVQVNLGKSCPVEIRIA